jgi:non-ribosomal peptide synthetase component F
MTPAIANAYPETAERRGAAGLLDTVRAAARDHPDAPALQLGRRVYTYAEVDATARCWAAALTEAAGHPPRRVGVFAYRSPVSYLGALAAVYAGATVVPLDRTLPIDVTRAMIKAAGPDVLLADSASALQLPRVAPGSRVPVVAPLADASLPLDARGTGRRVLRRADIPGGGGEPAACDGRGTAYLFFDGACGTPPRPIAFTHAALADFLGAVQERYGFGPEDRFAQVFDQSCDLSLFDLFAAWQAGACVVPLQPLHVLDPVRFVGLQRITVWFSSPAVAELARQRKVLHRNRLPSLRWSLFGGGPMSAAVAAAWQSAAPGSAVECLYGPPGLPVAGAVHRWDPLVSPRLSVGGLVPIGRPFPGVCMAVLDGEGRELPNGRAGELCFGGPGIGALGFGALGIVGAVGAVGPRPRRTGPEARANAWWRTGVSARRTAAGEYVRAAAPRREPAAAAPRALTGVAAGAAAG